MKINLTGPICRTSYGYSVTNILQELCGLGVEVSLFPIGKIEVDKQAFPSTQFLSDSLERAKLFDYTAPTVRIFHQFSMAESIGKGRRIGFPIFELDTLTLQEKHHLSSLDEIWVASSWAREILDRNGITVPTRVVPLGYNPKVFFDTPQLEGEKYIYLNLGKYERRKSQDELVEIFNSAFSDDDNVELWFCCSNPFDPQGYSRFKDIAKASKLGQKINFVDRLESQSEINQLINLADCLVFPSKAEGWNLELLEGLACNKPCVATNYSAHTEFCHPKEVCLISGDEMELAEDNIFFFKQGSWLKITKKMKDEFAAAMFDHYKSDIRRNPGQGKTAKYFTWENTARTILSYLEQ